MTHNSIGLKTNMPFEIGFESLSGVDSDLQSFEAHGYLLIGMHRESFIVSLRFWQEADYWKHWKSALTRILEGKSSSCLITSLYDHLTANFIEWWPMYRRNEIVYIQNHLLFLTELKEKFDIDDPFRFIPDYSAVSDDGDKISEWIVTVDAIRLFIENS